MRHGDNSHFTDEEIEAQNGSGMCSKVHSWLTCIVSDYFTSSKLHCPGAFSSIVLLTRGVS